MHRGNQIPKTSSTYVNTKAVISYVLLVIRRIISRLFFTSPYLSEKGHQESEYSEIIILIVLKEQLFSKMCVVKIVYFFVAHISSISYTRVKGFMNVVVKVVTSTQCINTSVEVSHFNSFWV